MDLGEKIQLKSIQHRSRTVSSALFVLCFRYFNPNNPSLSAFSAWSL